jgi:ATP-dependent Clp protease ATP-binding subunit ClpC
MLAPSSPVFLAPPSADHGAALAEGQRLATAAGRALGSADVLCGLVTAGGAAARLLGERGVTTTGLQVLLPRLGPEPGVRPEALARMSLDIARSLGARQTSSLHLLLALLRAGGGAVELLRLGGQDPSRLRAIVLRALTGPGRLQDRTRRRDIPVPPPAPSPLTPVASVSAPSARSIAPQETPAAATSAEPVGPDLAPLPAPASPVLHREREIGRLLDLLQAPRPRIIGLVGEPGSGRSAVLAALAGASAQPPLSPIGAPAGSLSPGAWIEKLHRQAPAVAALALDGCGLLAQEGSDGPAQLLATARAGRRWILAATPADVRRFELSMPELAAGIELVTLSPLTGEALVEILETGLDHLADASGVRFSAEVAPTLLRLGPRYPSDLAQPGRALTIAGVAAARARRLSHGWVTEKEVVEVVSAAADIPAARLMRSDDERFRTLEQRLAERVVGHQAARSRIADLLRRSYAGFRGTRPLASLLLLGPTGVGKTETARAIAEALFDGDSALLRIDLSEYSEPHAVARLIGSPPGYVGYEEGGQLTEAIRRRPASVVLLDELEKAHREVLLVLLQVLEDGRLTDGRGRTVDFGAAAVVMTSNLGTDIGKRGRAPSSAAVLAAARSRLPAELWNRMDEVLCYAPLRETELAGIVARFARESSRRLQAERGISFVVDDAVIAEVLDAETDRSLGARPLRRAFERLVEGPIANRIVAGNLPSGSRLRVAASGEGEITVTAVR